MTPGLMSKPWGSWRQLGAACSPRCPEVSHAGTPSLEGPGAKPEGRPDPREPCQHLPGTPCHLPHPPATPAYHSPLPPGNPTSLTPSTPKRSHMVHPQRKSISKLWFRMMTTCSFPKWPTVAWSVNRVHSVRDHHSRSMTSSEDTQGGTSARCGPPHSGPGPPPLLPDVGRACTGSARLAFSASNEF